VKTVNTKTERSFGERLRELRKQRSLSQTELGEITGLHFTNISRYERNLSQPGAETLKRIADSLSIPSDYLMAGTVEEAAKAHFEDRELLNQFKEVDRLPDDKKQFIKRVLDALLVKEKLRDLAF
jgi:transcriptional regulator with XRE-family HTH domain